MTFPGLPVPLGGFIWFGLALGVLLLSQRWLNRELQGVLLLLTRRPAAATAIFALLFFPGVFLHEMSHYLAARLLGVRTGRISFIPRALPGGQLRLGFVEISSPGALRDALIGAAPLVTGGLLVAWIGLNRLGLAAPGSALAAGNPSALLPALGALTAQPDFWIWFYLLFAISSTMFPSPSDRRSWLQIGLPVAGLLGIVLLAGAGPWLSANIGPWLERALVGLAGVWALSVSVQLALALPLAVLRLGLQKITGLEIVPLR